MLPVVPYNTNIQSNCTEIILVQQKQRDNLSCYVRILNAMGCYICCGCSDESAFG